MITSDLTLGRVKVRLELVPILACIAVLHSPSLAIALLLTIVVHELGHFLAARLLGLRGQLLVLQVTGAGSYIRDVTSTRVKALVLFAGPLASLLVAFAALVASTFVTPALGLFRIGDLFTVGLVWSMYQLTPFPPLDGGQLLRLGLRRWIPSATLTWRIGWVAGLAAAVAYVVLDPTLLQTVVLFTGMAFILGRAESGYVRHLDAYEAWERGDHRAVLEVIRKMPEYLDRDDKRRLYELGLLSAMELGDEAAIEAIAAQLSVGSSVVLAAADWLLVRRRPHGAKLAQRAFDGLDAEWLKLESDDQRERFADLAFRYAAFEAYELRPDSALGLLERAIDFGFRDVDRLEAHADLQPLRTHPRWRTIKERLVVS